MVILSPHVIVVIFMSKAHFLVDATESILGENILSSCLLLKCPLCLKISFAACKIFGSHFLLIILNVISFYSDIKSIAVKV